MGGVLAKRQTGGGGGGGAGGGVGGTTVNQQQQQRSRRMLSLPHRHSLEQFNIVGLATNLTHRFSVLSGLSVISFVSAPVSEANRRPWTRVSRKRWRQSTLENEYAHSKAVWPVAQTEALFLPEFPVGIEEKPKLVFLGEVSRGAFGQVFHVKCATSNKEYAMKVLSKSQVCSLDAVSQVKQEVMIQHICSHHPFITPLIYYWQTRKLLLVMTEFVGYGELQQLWRSLGRLPENLVKIYLVQIALAVDFLHNAGVIYRDLKMENILLDAQGHIKIIDFGLAKWLSYGGRTRTICGTLQFMAPEVLRGEDYNHSVDWWSLGIIVYSLLTGQYPVSGYDDHITMSLAVSRHTYKPPEAATVQMQEAVMGLLQRDPHTRTHTLHQLQREEIFRNYDFDMVREKLVWPRRVLEEHIDNQNRRSFNDFAGLTSTPKKALQPSLRSLGDDTNQPTAYTGTQSYYTHTHAHTDTPSQSLLLRPPATTTNTGGATAPGGWRGAGQRSASSPLLHPGRLGHHDTLNKSVSIGGYNGAAVPLLQSPLLRLARGGGQAPLAPRGTTTPPISASALPTAVSPLLVNIQRPQRFVSSLSNDDNNFNDTNNRCDNHECNDNKCSSNNKYNVNTNNRFNNIVKDNEYNNRFKNDNNSSTNNKFNTDNKYNDKVNDINCSNSNKFHTNNQFNSSGNIKYNNNNKFLSGMNGVYKKKYSDEILTVSLGGMLTNEDIRADTQAHIQLKDAHAHLHTLADAHINMHNDALGGMSTNDDDVHTHVQPKDAHAHTVVMGGMFTNDDIHSDAHAHIQTLADTHKHSQMHTDEFLQDCENLKEEFFCDLVTSTPKKSAPLGSIPKGSGRALGSIPMTGGALGSIPTTGYQQQQEQCGSSSCLGIIPKGDSGGALGSLPTTQERQQDPGGCLGSIPMTTTQGCVGSSVGCLGSMPTTRREGLCVGGLGSIPTTRTPEGCLGSIPRGGSVCLGSIPTTRERLGSIPRGGEEGSGCLESIPTTREGSEGIGESCLVSIPTTKNSFINGALIFSNNNFSALDENDFDESFDNFPWISESLDP